LEISYKVPCENSILNFNMTSDKDLQNAVMVTLNSPYLELHVHVTDKSKNLIIAYFIVTLCKEGICGCVMSPK
jgi:hypothetical protein